MLTSSLAHNNTAALTLERRADILRARLEKHGDYFTRCMDAAMDADVDLTDESHGAVKRLNRLAERQDRYESAYLAAAAAVAAERRSAALAARLSETDALAALADNLADAFGL